MTEVFALLDDRDATALRPTSRLYTGFLREHRCTDPATLDATWTQVEADQRAGAHALLLADYEWGAKLLKAGHARLAVRSSSSAKGDIGVSYDQSSMSCLILCRFAISSSTEGSLFSARSIASLVAS